MKINLDGISLIKTYEKLVLHTYDDATGDFVGPNSLIRGVLTIGYGHTGKGVYPGLIITEAEADNLLSSDLLTTEFGVSGLLRSVETNENEFSAMVAFAFNVGIHAFKESSVRRLHIAGDKKGAAAAFGLWNKVTINGKKEVSKGLIRRRESEKQLYLQPV